MTDRVGQQLGNYRLLRELGRGAFAEVYLAEHRYLERLAAVKVLRVQMATEAQERFRREARTIAHLQHPHIVQVLEFGLDGQTPYLVMEYTPGGTLRSQHPTGTHLPFEQIVTYVKQIASALDYAHQQRVIHRDVKPDNLLLNANYEVVLSDFGIAVVQLTLDSPSMSHPEAGTPLYMAPEQIQRQPCAASDQYALGIMVYEWLVGEAPFQGTLFEVFSHHLHQPPPSLRERLPGLPLAVEETVFKALAKDPAQRFASVTDFALALEEACDVTQTLTLPWQPKQSVREPTVSASTQLASPLTAREQKGASFSTQLTPMTMPRTERREEAVPEVTPRPAQPRLPVSKPVKLSLDQSNRQRFLRRVRTFWIDGVLEHSLHGAALIALGLHEQLDALANPWHLVLQHPDTAPRSFPLGTRILEVYDAANGQLLILGAPGSGKTTLVLELARDLLTRAEQDAQQQMPVIFTLSSWAAKQQPLAEWMREELINKYQVPRQLAQLWVETEQLLPLLDGLDEVATEKRTKCIETINTYHQEHAFLSLVVSSRSADYLAQTERVRLTSAVTIQSLTQQQVDDYLAGGGESLWALQVALRQDVLLRELAETPLMLSILTLTYHDISVEDLLQGGIAPTRQQIFERYVDRMLVHRPGSAHYTPEQTRNWLAWLAKQLVQRGQTVFYIERMQQNWLSGEQMHRVYHRWALRFPAILIGILVNVGISSLVSSQSLLLFDGFVGGFIGWLLSAERTAPQLHMTDREAREGSLAHLVKWLRGGTLIGLVAGLSYVLSTMLSTVLPDQLRYGMGYTVNSGLSTELITGLVYGLIYGLISILLKAVFEKSNRAASSFQASQLFQKPKRQHIMKSVGIRNGLIVGLLLGLGTWVSVWWGIILAARLNYGNGTSLITGVYTGLSVGLSTGLSVGLSTGLLSILLVGKSVGISLSDELVWSWKGLGQSLLAKKHLKTTLQVMVFIFLSVGLSVGLTYGLSLSGLTYYGLLSNGLIYGLSGGLSVGLSFWLGFGLFQGVSSETIGDEHRIIPNQGIRRSVRNGLVLGLISIGIVWLSSTLSNELILELIYRLNTWYYGLTDILYDELYYGLLTGVSAGLLAGLLNGGLAAWRHYVLRFLLRRNKSIPWHYPRFLDYAAEHILLRKVGGGYIFIHRLLLEYFASLDTTSPPDGTRVKKRMVAP